jgi:hypothetical protein
MLKRSGYLNIIYLLLLTLASSYAGLPVVTLDCNPEKNGNCPPPANVIAGESIFLAVTVLDVQNLHSYSVKCEFNPHVITFAGAVARLSPLASTFLESRHGHMAAFLSFSR